ncbi:cellulase family glycosylhydrolase [Mycolicibacterium sp. Y3]
MYTTNAILRAKHALVAAAVTTTIAASLHTGALLAAPAEHPLHRESVSTAVALVNSESSTSSNTSIGVADSTLYNLSHDELVERLNDMKSLGVTDLRVGVPWVYIQPTRDTYDWSKMDNVVDTAVSLGFSITGDITGNPAWDGTVLAGAPNPTAYANFASAVATRYGTKIGSYEIWNEPNGVVFFAPVSAAKYTEVLKAAYTAIKAANPDAVVVAGALGAAGNIKGISQTASDFLTAMYAAGAKGYFDALSYHPYGTTLPFSSGSDVNNAALQQIQALYATMVANGDGDLKIWGTEYGNATVPVIGVNQTEQAQFLQDFVTAWTRLSFTGPAFVYTAQDIHTGLLNAEANFGLYNSDGTPKQAALVLAKLIADLAVNGSLPDYTAPKLSQARDAYLQLTSIGFGLVNTALIIPNAVIDAAYQQMPTAGKKVFSAIADYVSARFVQMVAAMAPLTQAGLGAVLNIGPAMKNPQAAVAAAVTRFNRDLQSTGQAVAAALSGTRATLARLEQPTTPKAITAVPKATAAPEGDAATAKKVEATTTAAGDDSDAATVKEVGTTTAAAGDDSDSITVKKAGGTTTTAAGATTTPSTVGTSNGSNTAAAEPVSDKTAAAGTSKTATDDTPAQQGGRHRKPDSATTTGAADAGKAGSDTAASTTSGDTATPRTVKHRKDTKGSAEPGSTGTDTSKKTAAPRHAASADKGSAAAA